MSPSKGQPLVTIRGLSYTYPIARGQLRALENINISLDKSEVVAIIGPSGSGKSTLLQCVGGLLPFSDGQILINGRNPTEARLRKWISFAFQEAALLAWRTVADNIRLPLELGIANKESYRVEELLKLTRLEKFRDFYPDELSGGMKQRANFARSLITRPQLLLLDEPFGSLDPLTRLHLTQELSRIVREMATTVLFVTHSIEEAAFMASRVIILSPLPGKIVADIPISLPKHRDAKTLHSPSYLKLTAQCRDLLYQTSGHQ